jgi:hypothetical protein
MQDFYVFDGRLNVIGRICAEDQKSAERQTSIHHGISCRVTPVRGQTQEEAERYIREELNDRK